jgi:SAM-dependent methyltransferase
MPDDYKQLVYQAILDEQASVQPSFIRATFTGYQSGTSVSWVKVVLRPVQIKTRMCIQFVYYDEKKSVTKNYHTDSLVKHLHELLAMPFRNIHVSSVTGNTQVKVTKRGKPLIHHGKADRQVEAPDLAHNRQKELLLPDGKPDAYLQAIGFMTQNGQIRADKQKKFKQTNEFLKLIQQTGELENFAKPRLEVADLGCGNAYLTFAVYHYLNHVLQIPAHIVGVDIRSEPLAKHAKTVAALGWSNLRFEQSPIVDYAPFAPPDITLALHACDTATDEALAQGIKWGSKLIISVPCCHHDLQKQLDSIAPPESLRPVTRHGILAERMGDVLTDAFRALILRIMGYQTDVLQFISAEHTAKNVMIRAVASNLHMSVQLMQEYTKMKEYWQVTPYLEHLLGDALTERLTLAGSPPKEPAEIGN